MLASKSFSFSAECKALEATLKKVVSIMSSSSNSVFFLAAFKKKVYVIGMSGDTFVSLVSPNSVASKEGAFGFAPDTLSGLIRNRNTMDFDFNGQDCSFKQTKGPYKGNIVTLPITGDQQSTFDSYNTPSKKTGSTLSSDVLALLRTALNSTNIKDVYQGSPILSYIALNSKGLLNVSSFDGQHFGLYSVQTDLKGSEFKIALPGSHFALIEQASNGTDAKFTIGKSSIKVEGAAFKVVLPATQVEDSHYTMVDSFIKELGKPTYSCKYAQDKLAVLTDNLFTLYATNTSFTISAKGEGPLSVSFTTPSGTASDSLKVKASTSSKPFKASVDPRLLKDILTLSKDIAEPTLYVTDKVLLIKGAADNAVLSLACARSE